VWRCNSHEGNIFQSFCNRAKHLSVFIFQCSLLRGTRREQVIYCERDMIGWSGLSEHL
jgi:hypothetical protein